MPGVALSIGRKGGAPKGVTSDKKISNLKKPGKQPKVGGVSTPFTNRIAKGIGVRR